jgi:hypothetical protein
VNPSNSRFSWVNPRPAQRLTTLSQVIPKKEGQYHKAVTTTFSGFVNARQTPALAFVKLRDTSRTAAEYQDSGQRSPTILAAFCARVAWPMREIAQRSLFLIPDSVEIRGAT